MVRALPGHGNPPVRSVRSRAMLIQIVLMIAALVVAPFVVYPIFLMKVLCYALLASSVNLLLGFGGMLSFGQAAYFGIGAYTTAWAMKTLPLTPELAVLGGMLGAALCAIPFGALAIRREGVYLAMITLALGQIVYFIVLQSPFSNGEDGIQAVPRGQLFGLVDLASTQTLYMVTSTVFVLVILLILRMRTSPFGEVVVAIRDNKQRAISLGFDPTLYRWLLFLICGAIAGLAGGMKAIVFQLATLTDVHWATSGSVVLMVLVGGSGTLMGPIIGALIVVAIENYLAHLGPWVTFVQGTIFVISVLLFRKGIVGAIAGLSRREGATT